MSTTHQTGQAVFGSVRPEDVDWEPFAPFPPPARLAVVVLPGGTPHSHWARSGAYVTPVQAIGPIGLQCVNSRVDPRAESEKP
jgi:hypothetical protein